MPRTIGSIVEILLKRIRQEGGLALSPDVATEVYSHCEQIINSKTHRVVSTTTLTLPKQKLIHDLQTLLPSCVNVLKIYQGNREIYRCQTSDEFPSFDAHWIRNITGTRIEGFFTYGNDLLLIYPGQLIPTAITIHYISYPEIYNDFAKYYNTDSSFPSEDVNLAISLAEIILLARYRLLANIDQKIKELISSLSIRGTAL